MVKIIYRPSVMTSVIKVYLVIDRREYYCGMVLQSRLTTFIDTDPIGGIDLRQTDYPEAGNQW